MQLVFEEFWSESLIAHRHFLGRSSGQNNSAVASALRPHVNNIVGKFYYVKIVLDDDYRVAAVNELLENVHQYAYIFEMKPCCWFVEYVNSLARIALA